MEALAALLLREYCSQQKILHEHQQKQYDAQLTAQKPQCLLPLAISLVVSSSNWHLSFSKGKGPGSACVSEMAWHLQRIARLPAKILETNEYSFSRLELVQSEPLYNKTSSRVSGECVAAFFAPCVKTHQGETSMSNLFAGVSTSVSKLFAGVKNFAHDIFNIERPAGVSGTGPTVAEQDCQQEGKDQDESQPSKRQRHDDGFITAPTSPTADLTSNVGESTRSDKRDLVDLITSKEDEAMVDEQDHWREQAGGASGKRDSILRIMRYINDGAGNNTHLQHKRHVIVLGLTGSGKSTTINSLAGCKLRLVTEEEASIFECSRRALVVASGDERCWRKEVTKIGSRSGKSQTKVLQAVAVDEKDDGTVPTFSLILIIMSNISLFLKLR
jgi:hypothetical protein